MPSVNLKLFGAVVMFSATACSLFSGKDTSKPEIVAVPESSTTEKPPMSEIAPPAAVSPVQANKNDDEVYLRQARMVARMDEIEDELKRHREKIRLLEQGLLTGIAPDDLKSSNSSRPSSKSKDQGSAAIKGHEITLVKPDLDAFDAAAEPIQAGREAGSSVSVQESTYNEKMQLAKEHYQAGRFGLAIAELAGISREFGQTAGEGAVRFWLGKSYLGLREFSTARSEFESYLKGWPSGEFVGQIRIDLAKAFVGLGLKERARSELRRVMKDFPGQEVSEIASLEFQKLQGGL